jgi:hypothetical protein
MDVSKQSNSIIETPQTSKIMATINAASWINGEPDAAGSVKIATGT